MYRKKVILITVSIVVIAAGEGLLFARYNNLFPFQAKSTYKPGEHAVNLDRSDTEKKSTDTLKEQPELKTQNSQTDAPIQPTIPSDGTKKGTVSVLLTNAGIFNSAVSASGMVTNIAEEGGSCEFVFTSGDKVIKKTTETLINPTSTTCKTVTFSASELTSKGAWRVNIVYSSSAYEGTSNERNFDYQ